MNLFKHFGKMKLVLEILLSDWFKEFDLNQDIIPQVSYI